MRSTFLHGAATAITLSAGALLFARDAGAAQPKRTATGAPVHFAAARVEMVLAPSLDDAAPGARDAVLRALGAWSGVGGAPVLVATDGGAGEAVAVDGRNVISYAEDGFAPAGRALAVTVLSFDPATGEIVDADIVINVGHALEVLPDGARASDGETPVAVEGGARDERAGEGSARGFDVEHVVVHELGHALGLGDDTAAPGAVMFPYTARGDASLRAPTADDLAGLAALYAPATAATAPAHGAACSVTRGPVSVPAPPMVITTLALAATVSRRRAETRGAERAPDGERNDRHG